MKVIYLAGTFAAEDYRNRVKYKPILEEFDSDLTEWQNMQLNDYDRIWDCGNYIFKFKE